MRRDNKKERIYIYIIIHSQRRCRSASLIRSVSIDLVLLSKNSRRRWRLPCCAFADVGNGSAFWPSGMSAYKGQTRRWPKSPGEIARGGRAKWARNHGLRKGKETRVSRYVRFVNAQPSCVTHRRRGAYGEWGALRRARRHVRAASPAGMIGFCAREKRAIAYVRNAT